MSRSSQQPGRFDRAAKLVYNRLWAVAKKADGKVGGPAMARLKADWAAGTVGSHLGKDDLADYAASLAALEAPETAAVRRVLGDGEAAAHKVDLALLETLKGAKAGTAEFKQRDAARKRVARRRSQSKAAA